MTYKSAKEKHTFLWRFGALTALFSRPCGR